MTVPYTFATASSPIPLSQLDANFAALGTSSNINYNQGGTGAVTRTVQNKLQESVSVKDFGAVGDGVADDTAAIQNAELNIPVYAPSGIYSTTTANFTFLSGKQIGSGQIKTADGNKSAPYFSIVSSPPTSTGNQSSVLTAFNGDISRIQFPVSHVIQGATTLTQPASGYYISYETSAFYTQLFNTSGWNQSTSLNDGRTLTNAFTTKVTNSGQGDTVCYFGSGLVTGTKAGSTSFLANPAAGLFAGQMDAGANGVYLNPYEVNLQDDGYDVACVGIVNNLSRTNNTGAKNVFWAGYTAQSTGSVPADSIYLASGLWKNGLDLVPVDFGANQSAISLKANQRIYLNNTATPTGGSGIAWVTNNYSNDYIQYAVGTDTGIQLFVGGVQSLTVRSDTAVLNNANGLTIKNTGILRFEGSSQAVTGSSTALFSATNKPGATSGQAPAKWLTIVISGTTHYIPCWIA